MKQLVALLALITIVMSGLVPAAEAANGSVLSVFAVGETGEEILDVVIDGQRVTSLELEPSAGFTSNQPGWVRYDYTHDEPLRAAQVRLEFNNNQHDETRDRNLRVDKIEIDGGVFESEDPSVFGKGVYTNSACQAGYFRTDTLHCAGFFQYNDGSLPIPTGDELLIVAKGKTGDEYIDIVIEDVAVGSVDLSKASNFRGAGDWRTYTYTHTGPLTASQVRLEFNNDLYIPGVTDRDIRIDKITINNTDYQTKDPLVTGKGIWTNNACRTGNFQTDLLTCKGHFQYHGGPTTPPDDSTLSVTAVGRTGDEEIDVMIDDVKVTTLDLDSSTSFFDNPTWRTYTYTHTGPLTASQVRLEFNNDLYIPGVTDRDIRIDKITINNTDYQTKDPLVTGKGIWTNNACRTGNFQTDLLTCKGHFQYHGDATPPPGEQSPVANAGPAQTLIDTDENGVETVNLDGSESFDPDGTIVAYEWLQGQQVIATGVRPTIDLGIGNHEIALRVTDDDGLLGEASVSIIVDEPSTASELKVRAVGSTGQELIVINIDGVPVRTFSPPRSSSWFGAPDPGWGVVTYSHPTLLRPEQVRLEFINDGSSAIGDRNVRVDRIEVDGQYFETEGPDVISRGSWGNGSTCSTGTFQNDNLYCNGFIQYSEAGEFEITEVATNISTPWGVDFLPGGDMIFTERIGRINVVDRASGAQSQITADMTGLAVTGTSGLLGLAVDPDYETNRRFYTCQTRSAPDVVELIVWQMNTNGTAAQRVGQPLLSETTAYGHVGCQVRIDGDGYLWISIGDDFIGTNPQDLTTHNGKVLRIDRFSGEGAPDNPFASSLHPTARRVYSYGHRNVQGIAFGPDGNQVWAIGHGSAVDDEINLLTPGGNYGWDPVPEVFPVPDERHPEYDEYNNPMTDLAKFPDAIEAAWSSGDPTVAPGGGDFLVGSQWGDHEGALAVAILKDAKLTLFRFDAAGNYVSDSSPIQLDGTFDRLRSATLGPDGALYVTTTNSGFGPVDPRVDKILRVAPSPSS